MTTVIERLREDRPVFSVEFNPPRNEEEEQILWRSVRQLEQLDPAYVSVTYGAGGTRRDRTIRTTGRMAQETTVVPMAHLTAVDHSIAELRNVIGWYAAVGVQNVLAIRGDPPGDPMGDWIAHPEGLTYADEMVRLIRELGDFCVGVAAFPYGHPRSVDLDSDIEHLIRKFDAGAEFAIAQLFFAPEDFLRLRDRLAARGREPILVPGMMPLTTPRMLHKAIELSGVDLPPAMARQLDPLADDPKAFRAAGIDVITDLCQRLLDEGIGALHFYTMNRATATKELVHRLGLLPVHA